MNHHQRTRKQKDASDVSLIPESPNNFGLLSPSSAFVTNPLTHHHTYNRPSLAVGHFGPEGNRRFLFTLEIIANGLR